MKYINTFSREGFVNLFADYLIKNTNYKTTSRFQVVDFKSFVVVYGATSSENVLDLNKIRDSFVSENKKLIEFLQIKHFNIIDLIDYREPLKQIDYHFEYFKSDRPLFRQEVLDEVIKDDYNKEYISNINYTDKLEIEFYSPFLVDDIKVFNSTNFLSVSSSFPYGYSLNLGRSELYYGEYICNQLFNILETDKIIFKYSSVINNEDDFNIEVTCDSIYTPEKIKSLILDVFDFNLNKFINDYLKNYNLEKDLDNQLNEKPWLVKDRMKDLVIF